MHLRKIYPVLLVCFLLGLTNMGMIVRAQPNLSISFDKPEELANWVIINDTVMGGRSEAKIRLEDNLLSFTGSLSLANNGGFASTRRAYSPVQWLPENALKVTILGDGRSYQFRLRTNKNMDGVSYVAEFKTSANEPQILHFTLQDFTPQYRGRVVRGAPNLAFEDVVQLGFMLADKRPGEFKLKVQSITQVINPS